MGIPERVASALHASDLTMNLGRACPPDVLVAMGYVGRRNRVGVAMVREQLSVGEVGRIAREEVASYCLRSVIPYCDEEKPAEWWHAFCTSVVAHWLSPTCPSCEGRKYLVTPGTPHLSTHTCHQCNGTGEKKPPRIKRESMGRDPWNEYWRGALKHLDSRESAAIEQIKHVLTRHR